MERRPLSPAPVLRRARVLQASGPADDGRMDLQLRLLDGPLSGSTVPGRLYGGPAPRPGAVVTANTLGIEMGLGTGGVAFVLPEPGGKTPANENHFVKLPYTPLQATAGPPPQAENLAGVPVVVLSLHSHLAPAACAVAALLPRAAGAAGAAGARTCFVQQEGGALPVGFSETVRELKEKRLLHEVVSSGNCYGGDFEAPNIYSGLLAAASPAVAADVVICGIGPGVVGTASRYGHGGMSAALALNAACALGGEPVLSPRISGADPRERHRGFSHHSRAALSGALAGCRIAIPGVGAGRYASRGARAARLRPGALRGGWIRGALRGNLPEHGPRI